LSVRFGNEARFGKIPQAVIFDTDNTLYDYRFPHKAAMNEVISKAESLLKVNPRDFQAAFDAARQKVKERLGQTASSHSRLLYFQRTIENLGFGTQLLMTLDLEQTYWRTFLNHTRLFDDVKEFVLDLRASGISTAIITDLTAQIQFRKLIYFGMDDCFDYVVTSEEAGQDKPSEAPFQLALEKLKCDATRCWMIGDNWEADVVGASAIGMTTLMKTHTGVESPPDGVKPDLVFSTFSQLQALLKDNGWLSEHFDERYV
jgi:HAD superfamily hydrolase (TIGR01549 family)